MMMAKQRTPRRSATRLCHRDGDKASRVAQSSSPRGPHIRAHAGLLTPEALAAAQRVLCRAAVPSSGCNIFNNNALHGSPPLSSPLFDGRGRRRLMGFKMVRLERAVKPLAKSVAFSALICSEAWLVYWRVCFCFVFLFCFCFFVLQFMGVVWWNPVQAVHEPVCNKQDLC